MKKQLLINLDLSILVTVSFFLILEVCARWYGFVAQEWDQLDSDLGWTMQNPPHEMGPPLEEAEVVLLGDSITVIGNFEQETFTTLLHQEDRKVANLSAIGWATDQEFLFLKQMAPRLPNVKWVFLQFCLFNDIIDNAGPVNVFDGFRRKPYFTIEGDEIVLQNDHINYTRMQRSFYALRQKSGTVHFLMRIFQKLRIKTVTRPERLRVQWHFSKAPPTDEKWFEYAKRELKGKKITRRLLLEMEHFVHNELKAKLVILLHPHLYYPDNIDRLTISPKAEEIFLDLPTTIVDMSCIYRSQKLKFQDIASDRVGHLNTKGHNVVAQTMEDVINETPPFPRCLLSTTSPFPLPGDNPP